MTNTPTDDEREALDQIVREHDGWWPETRDAILALYARRTELPEPSAEKPDIEYRDSAESDNWVLAVSGASDRDIETARRENERLGWQKYRVLETEPEPEPQGEPSDAQLLAALNAYYVPDGYPGQTLEDWSEGSVRAMRAALSAAGGVR